MRIRCGSCHDGLYKLDFIEIGSYDENIIYGYGFCELCRQHTDEAELVARAHNENAQHPFTEQQTA